MVFILSAFGLLAIVMQMISPRLPFLEMPPFLVALPVVYGAMRLTRLRPFYVAIFLGSVIDILSPQKFGTESVVLSLMVGIAWSQRENFPFDSYLSVLILVALATFLGVVLDYTFFCWQSGNWDWHFTMWVRMVWVGLINMVLAIPFFLVCDLVLVKWLKAPGEPSLRDYAV